MDTVEEVLAHFGVKGMKWGVRRSDAVRVGTLGAKAVAARPLKSPTKATFNAHVKTAGGLHKISDKDLQAMLNRLDMEKRYTNMQNEDAAKRAAGRKATLKFLGEAGKIALPILIGVAAKSAADRGAFRTTAFTARRAIGK